MSILDEVDIDRWVESEADSERKEFREAVHTILSAIASDEKLKASMILKGGILLAIRYQSHRYTKDIDLSTTQVLKNIDPCALVEQLNASLAHMVEILDYDLDCAVQSHKVMPASQPNATFPSIRLTIGYAYKGTPKHKRLLVRQSPSVISIDYSLNEAMPYVDKVKLTQSDELLVYSLIDLVAEKLRSLLQQEIRGRHRRQDVFDIYLILNQVNSFDEVEKNKIHGSLLKKSKGRGINPQSTSFDNPELRRRAEVDYSTLTDEIGDEFVGFDQSFGVVAAFYKSLPW